MEENIKKELLEAISLLDDAEKYLAEGDNKKAEDKLKKAKDKN